MLMRQPPQPKLNRTRLPPHASNPKRVWLVNTGWIGGPYRIGARMRLSHTRAIVRAKALTS
jgi:ATP-dependent phosphoenolpyruvate carboxykinase